MHGYIMGTLQHKQSTHLPNTNPPLFLHLHKITLGTTLLTLHPNRTGRLQRPAIQQQLFRHGGFAGIGMGYDG